MSDKLTIVEESELRVHARCPNCDHEFKIDEDLFYPQDVGDAEYYNSCNIICSGCGSHLCIFHPKPY
jgi:hypothetical protein